MNILELSEQEIIRRNSLNELRAMGIDPYPAAEYVTNAFSTDIKAEFKDDEEPRQVSVAGRIMSRRVMGKASFIELQDSKGRIQVYITRDDICPGEDKELYNAVFKRLLDLGDFIGIEGFVFRTQMGEISIHAKKLTVLAKSIKPLPIVKYKDGVAYDSFEDPELRYRQRYVDLVVNDGIKETFLKRATVVKTLRNVLDEAGYTEVETPILQSIAGGASARPFITHHNSLDIDLYLRIATELYLKRLIVGGFEGVYEIGKNFRNEGMDKTHNPEFTCMELYVQYKDYNWMMNFTEKLLERICIAVNGCTESVVDGKTISFKAPYRRLPILDAIKEKTGYDLNGKSEEEIRQVCKELKMEEIDETMGKGKLIDEIFGEFCEGTYIQPTFITTARKQREVIIGFLTAPSYKLMLFYLKASPCSSPQKREPEDRVEIRLINKSIGRKVLNTSYLEEDWEEASTSTSIPFTKRDCPATTTCELSGTPDFNSYSVPMRLPSSTLL